ncbi:MAG: hypothetical protein WAO55_04775 [Candidatus Manganitrophaceae bacterium]
MAIPGLVVFMAVVFIGSLLFIPFFVEVDSGEKCFSVRWFFGYMTFLFSEKKIEIRCAGMTYRKKRAAKMVSSLDSEGVKEEGESARPVRALRRTLAILLSNSTLIIDLVGRFLRYLLDLLRAFSISHLRLDLSFDDPMINGLCYGAFQGVRERMLKKRVDLSANFCGENRLVGKVVFSLYRLILPTLRLLVGLPYLQMFRFYRSIRYSDPLREEILR